MDMVATTKRVEHRILEKQLEDLVNHLASYQPLDQSDEALLRAANRYVDALCPLIEELPAGILASVRRRMGSYVAAGLRGV